MSFLESIFYMAWRGIAIGLIISAPMGPVGMLCIQRTLDKGRRAGFYTGVGAAISDLFYSLLTGFGLSFIEEFLERNQNIIQLAGSAVLIAFGIYLFRKNPTRSLRKPRAEDISMKKNILGGFLFTFSNPLILFLIIGLFARFNFLLPEFRVGQYFTGFLFIFLGALLWWWIITFAIDKLRSHVNIRSMWLINKIIGVIIMIFAVVGIFSASSALARGEKISCWNGTRGLAPFGKISNPSADTLRVAVPCGAADAVEFRCKVRNHRAGVGKPAWGFELKGVERDVARISVATTETDADIMTRTAALRVRAWAADSLVFDGEFSDRTNIVDKISDGLHGPDPTGSNNFFKIAVFGDHLTLFGGLHSPERLLEMELPRGFRADSIGFFIEPHGEITADELRLTTSVLTRPEEPWSDVDLLDAYLEESADAMEGYVQVLDRSLDEKLLRMGGDYRLAMVRAEDGYDLLYMSGARVNASAWQPGMRKAMLRRSGIEGVWNVTWFDAMFQPLSHELKGQTDINGTLTIQFPYQNSTLRLHPSTPAAGSVR